MTVSKPAKLSEIGGAIDLLLDPTVAIESKGAAYAVLHQVQLRINRILRGAQPELIEFVRGQPGRVFGPLSVSGESVGVAWPCNAPGNWADEIVQGALRELARRPDVGRYVRHIPEHYEIDTREIAAGFADGDPALPELHRELTRKGFRTAESRKDRLKVKEA